MGWKIPPKDWQLVTGTWATDADRDESVAKSGAYCLQLKNTAVASKFRSGWIAVEQDLPLFVAAQVRSDDITAGYNIVVKAEQYSADRLTLISTSTLYTGVPAVADTWEWTDGTLEPNSSTRWIRVTIEKTANTHNAYIDNVVVDRSQPGFDGFLSAATQSIPNATWTTVLFDYAYRTNMRFSGPATGKWTALVPGWYAFTSTVEFDTVSDQTLLSIRLTIKTPGSLIFDVYEGQQFAASGSMEPRLIVAVANARVQVGDEVYVDVFQNSGGAVNVIGDAVGFPLFQTHSTHFQAVRHSKI